MVSHWSVSIEIDMAKKHAPSFDNFWRLLSLPISEQMHGKNIHGHVVTAFDTVDLS
jgi:hypothetical protein